MEKLTVKTEGAATSNTLTVKQIADAMHMEVTGKDNAPEYVYKFITQDFVDKYGFTARYQSGTFLGGYVDDEAGEDFYQENLDRK